MDYKKVYPVKYDYTKDEYLLRRIIQLIFALGFIACGIVNISLGGRPWSLLVLVSEWLFWVIFVERPLVENSFAIKCQKIICSTSALLISILWFLKIYTLLPAIVIFLASGQIFMGLVLLLGYKDDNNQHYRLIYSMSSFIILIADLVLSIIVKDWYQFLLFGIAFLLFIINLIIYRKELSLEFKKRFGLKK